MKVAFKKRQEALLRSVINTRIYDLVRETPSQLICASLQMEPTNKKRKEGIKGVQFTLVAMYSLWYLNDCGFQMHIILINRREGVRG